MSEQICPHGVTVEGETTREQLSDLIHGSAARLTHLIICFKGHRLAKILARQKACRIRREADMHMDDATRIVEKLTGIRGIWS